MGAPTFANVGNQSAIEHSAMSNKVVSAESKIHINEHEVNTNGTEGLNNARATRSSKVDNILTGNVDMRLTKAS